MAILDTRLLPLIEALADSGADWLAFEILEGVRLGRVPEETHAELESTRSAVRLGKRQMRLSEQRAVPPPAPVPILGDEQIQWAAEYLEKRISDAVLMLQETLDQLERIISGAQTLDGAPSGSAAKEGVTLVLQTDYERLSVRRRDAAGGKAALSKLGEAIKAWVASVRNGGQSE
jgi:hypothetical protein